MQEEIMYAIESISISYFIDIGGLSMIDINFEVTKEGAFPLFIASIKGHTNFVKAMLEN